MWPHSLAGLAGGDIHRLLRRRPRAGAEALRPRSRDAGLLRGHARASVERREARPALARGGPRLAHRSRAGAGLSLHHRWRAGRCRRRDADRMNEFGSFIASPWGSALAIAAMALVTFLCRI